MATRELDTQAWRLEPLLSVREARQILGVSGPTIYRLMGDGQLPSVLVGGRRLIEPAELRRFIEARRQTVRAKAAPT